jgi:hypothetical protein
MSRENVEIVSQGAETFNRRDLEMALRQIASQPSDPAALRQLAKQGLHKAAEGGPSSGANPAISPADGQ